MKVKLWKDEWYPVYGISESDSSADVEVDLTLEQIAHLKVATESFEQIQNEIDEAISKQK